MRLFFLCIFTIFYISVGATNYYISALGNDANNGTSASTPWKTISKLNSAFLSLNPGDNILFEKGDLFYGNIIINKSGTVGSPITIGSYGSGSNPVISGFTTLTSWISTGTNLWQAYTGSALSTCNIVNINGVNTGMGRTPNANVASPYFNIDSYNGTSHTITSSSLTSNWTNGQVIVREGYSSETKYLIASQSGTTITYSQINQTLGTPAATGFGFFIQNSLNTLDQQGEWFYDGSSHNITIYSNSSPTGVKVSTIDNLLSDSRFNFIVIDGVDFSGANKDAIYLTIANNVTIKNSNISFCGANGLETSGGNQDSLFNTNINNVSNAGLFIVSDNMYIHNNSFNNIGIIHGQSDWSNRCAGIFTASSNKNQDIQYNLVKNTGACGIIVSPYSVVKYNFIDSTVLALSDFGGIYTGGNNEIWDHNIVTNTIGYSVGTNRPNNKYAEGLYLDEGSNNNILTNNSVSNSGNSGFKLHGKTSGTPNSNGNRIENNTFFNNTNTQIIIENDNSSLLMTADTVRYNICASYATNQLTLYLDDQHNNISSVGVFDYNYYMRPLDDFGTGKSIQGQTTSGYTQYNLTTWRTYSGYDLHSNTSPKVISNASDMVFRYNNTNNPITISLPYNYMDAKSVNYNGSITLQPYTSAVLIKNGTILLNKLPLANAGSDQSIILPTSLALLIGSGSDSDGTISTYRWAKLLGPAAGTMTDTTSASTIANGLVQGIYKFVLTVTDNLGGIGKDTMQVTVNAAVNKPPLVNAGSDQAITLPTNTINLSGGATDQDGTIASYAWTKVSGPSAYTITNASLAATTVTGLAQGTYQFVLKATDNSGASTSDTIQVIINPAPNVPPVANAGQAQAITLPTSMVTLSGSGSDTDGTVASYQWTEISGPSTYTIVNASSAITNITGLTAGIYQFQLMVTDNAGATGTDIVQVTVNAGANIPPVSNAGTDQTIALPTNSVSLSGSGSDADGTVTGYQWTEISGPATYTIVNASSPITNITGLIQGVYQFQLLVTDNSGATSIDIVQITVNAAVNTPPAANAGTNQSIFLPTSSVTLSGTGTDADGTIASYLWKKVSGPSTYNIVNASSPFTDVSGLVKGTYQFQLTVTDNSGAISTDIVQVKVNNGTNIAPVSNAGTDQTITLPVSNVTVAGSGTDADGIVASYLWTAISGPSAYTITNASSATTNITGLVQGTYQFQLVVTDNKGATATDVMQVIVNASVNVPPVSNAGLDQTITLPANAVTVSGNGTDADGTIASYQWTVISGPSTYSITSASSAVTDLTGLTAGVYQMQLTVTDNSGATSSDIVQVTVNAAANIPPVANAGANQAITLPTNIATLAGTGTDTDGTIASYQWTVISGPSTYTITNASAANTTVSVLIQGVYQLQLSVTDNNGAISTSITQVTVNAAANIPPVSNAGVDQSITLPTNAVTLSGSGTDTDGTVVSYQWTETSGPSSYSITNASAAVTSITGLAQGVYQFQLIVTDNSGGTSTDIVQVTVNAAVNIPPISNAGTDQTITLPTNTVTLAGSGTDADGAVVSYAWAKISGPAAYTMVNASLANTSITGLAQGTYQFALTVTDDNGATNTDTIQVTVNPGNIPPVSNAGVDQTITLPTNTVTLSGSGTDADGTIASYAWAKISGPASSTITNASLSSTSVTALTQGIYLFQLTVTDNQGAATADTMQVIVNPAANIPPVANAGTDQAITLPINSATLSGSGTDADGTIASYAWTKISGPTTYTITNAATAVTGITGLVQGVYQFQLKVTDNSGAVATDVMQLIVNASINVAPVANANVDQTITLPVSTVSLSGSGTDADGTIASYAWAKISGPTSYTITSALSAATTVTGLKQGVYKFRLTVTDNSGASATDIVQITVKAAVNIVPVSNAGIDQTITLPTKTVALSGTGTDADGTIAGYLWTKISGPSSYTITSASSANTNVTGLAKGVYQFQLKVTDNSGASTTDVMQVTVNAAANVAPRANAGVDQAIALPISTVSLSGSGSDSDGVVAAYVWTKISGPTSCTMTNASSPNTNVNGLAEGVYQFQLEVTDNDGAIATSITQVTVSAAPNVAPVANAGTDQNTTLPTNSISLAGSGTDADGTIASYAWTKISGPSSYTITDASLASTNVTGLTKGVYMFQLSVTDNSGTTSTDVMQVTVSAAPNVAPVANAGTDQNTTLPTNSISLAGSGTDADGTITSYSWTQISGPASAAIANASSANTNVNGLAEGIYQFQLKVTDNSGATTTDIMQVTVNAAANIPPAANAGIDQSITLPINSTTLTGSGTDADGTIASYVWTKISGPSSVAIANASSANTNVTGLTQGVYQFQLTVTDNSGDVATDIMQVVVNPAANVAPVSNAGADKTITLPINSVNLSGSGTDVDGTIASYTWTKVSGPSTFIITNATAAATSITGLVKGVYQFELKITDNDGAIGTDVIQVTVNAAPNVPPVSNAGADQTITLPTNTVSLTGTGTDADGTVASYIWAKVSGPSSFNIQKVSSAATNITGLTVGVYTFELRVSDNNGAISRDTVKVTVNPAPNVPPVANAGGNREITLPVNTTALAGSGTDVDGNVVSYIWSKVSGPSSTIVNASSPVTDVTDLLEGTYQFQLKITDNSGATSFDTMQVIVNRANSLPVANAGDDQTISIPTSSVILTGSGTDSDGTIKTYSWVKIDGPDGGDFADASDSVTSVNNLQGGTYDFELTVTDNQGGVGKDTVEIVVAEPRLGRDVQSTTAKIYPNPVTDITTLEINTTLAATSVKYVLTNSIGRIVSQTELQAGQSNIKATIDMTNLSKGMYTVSVYFDNKRMQSLKIVKL